MTEENLVSAEDGDLSLLSRSRKLSEKENAELKTQLDDMDLEKSIEDWELRRGSNHY